MKILWPISIGAAFFLGYSMNFTTKPDQNKKSQIIEQPNLNDSEIQNKAIIQLKKTTKLEKINAVVMVKPDLNNLLADLENLLDGNQFSFDMASIAQAYMLIENLTEDELLTTLSLMNGKLNKANNGELLTLLLGRLATFDPLRTANFIEDNIVSPQAKMTAMMSVISSWIKDDPTSAYNWYIDPTNSFSSDSNFSSIGFLAIFKGLASHDIDDAFTKLSELNYSATKIRMAAMGISQAIESKEDFIQFIQRSDELDDKSIKGSFISSWVLKNPLETVEWSESILDEAQQRKMQSTIFMNWTSTEPAKAADWFIGTANDSEKGSHATKIIDMWGRREPNAALAWLDQQAGFDTQKSIAKLLNSSAYMNTKFTIDNLDRLTSDKAKTKISYRIYQALQRSSSTKAAEFLSSSPYQEEIEKKQVILDKYKKEKVSPN